MGLLKNCTKIPIPITGGLDETSPVNKVDLKNALKMTNFRISRDGRRVEKRKGLVEEATSFAEDVFGYSTYYDSDSAYCQLAVLESEIQRKVGSGAWTKIHDFAANVAHPVKVLEIQGKQFVIQEGDSRMVHTDKADYQIGITAPATLPTASTSYPAEDTLPLNDTFAYANTGALDAIWTDGDAGNGASTMVTSGPSGQGNDAHSFFLKFTASSVTSTSVAKRSLTTTASLGAKYTLEINTYFDRIGGAKNVRDFQVRVYNGAFQLPLYFLWGNLSIFDSKNSQFSFTTDVIEDKWVTWKFIVDGSDSTAVRVKGYKDGVFLKEVIYAYEDTTNTDTIELIGNAKSASGFVPISYVDNIKITTDSPVVGVHGGIYRYAVTYFRGGNYGCESNPIKSVVGSASYTGSVGHDDIDSGGTYTGDLTKTFRVQIDGNGSPDTMKWSDDAGATWKSSGIPLTSTIYLSYGVSLTCTALIGHTIGDYWDIVCSACSVCAAGQKISLSGIPVSTDPQVTGRHLYRTLVDGSRFYWLATINDNTTTTYVDNLPDGALDYLGAELREDRDTAPNGKFSAWWDERLWISGDDIVYYSDIAIPENFDISSRYVTVQRGDTSDEITGLVPYKDSLYVFRKHSIYVIQKTSIAYGLFLITDDVGCVAPWSMVPVNNMLMFISYRGVELFNGQDVYGAEISLPVDRTIKSIDTTKYDLISAVHYPEKREVWFSLPDRTGGAAATTVVYHYLADAWYNFTFYKTPSCLSLCYDSSKAQVLKMGTRDGCLDLCEAGYQDNTTAISATYRKPWHELSETGDIRRLEVEYEIPSAMSLTANVYIDFDKDVQRTDALVGELISSTDIELRRPHLDFSELGQRAKYVSIEFINSENLGGDLKINEVFLYYRDRDIKGKVYGD